MRQLKDPNLTPPGGWRFIDPNTGYEFSRNYRNLHQLLLHVKQYRALNKLDPIPELRHAVEHYICNRPGTAGACRDYIPKRTVARYLRGGVALAETTARRITGRKAFESQDIADKRAAVCIRCPNNIPNPEHSYADDVAARVVGARKTAVDNKLFSCGICTCPLRSKVHLLQSTATRSLTDEERALLPAGLPGLDSQPLYCWLTHPVSES